MESPRKPKGRKDGHESRQEGAMRPLLKAVLRPMCAACLTRVITLHSQQVSEVDFIVPDSEKETEAGRGYTGCPWLPR